MQEKIKTQFTFSGIEFSYITAEDLPDLIRMLAKETVCEYVFFGPNSKEDTEAYFQPVIDEVTEALANGELPKQHVFILKKDGVMIGNCGIMPVPFSEGNFVIGYTIDEPFWRKGYGNIACQFIVDYGFSTLKARRLTGDCMGDNIESRKIMEKNGFVLEGCQKKYWHKNGMYHDNLLFGLFSHRSNE